MGVSSSEDIDRIFDILGDEDIQIVENEDEAAAEAEKMLPSARKKAFLRRRQKNRFTLLTTQSRCTLSRWVLLPFFPARKKSSSPEK